MSQLLIATSWKSSSLDGTPPGACSTSNWLACSARMMCCSLAAGSRETSSTRGLRSVTVSSKRASPRPLAATLPASAMAPTVLTLAWSRRRFIPAASSTSPELTIHSGRQLHFARADGLAFSGQLHAGVRCARRLHGDIDGEALAAEDLPGGGHAVQPQSGLGTSGQGHGIYGQAQLPRLPDGACHRAQVLIAVGVGGR